MNFKFNVTMTEQDYLDFNTFVTFNTSQGKRMLILVRALVTVLCLALAFALLLFGDFGVISIIGAVLIAAMLLCYNLGYKHWITVSLKKQIEKLKTQGKLPYSAQYTAEFTDVGITETDESCRSEYKYSVIEKISIYGGTVYIHLDAVRAIILPFSCFEAREQYEDFLGFISTKCPNIVRY